MNMRNYLLSIFLTMAAQNALAYTVCSMTMNSNEEIETMKKHLSAPGVDFVELGAEPEKFCRSKVSCDVVVMSGHFGGLFFGDKGDYTLEAMEKLSCDSDCNNLFANAKHVYLFGCNTLNGKNKDHRSPEQYVQALRDDHYYLWAAQQMAANIYSPFGDTYHNRMQHVFPKATQIYGFNAMAPSGRSVRPFLNKAFSEWKDRYLETLNNSQLEAQFTEELKKTMDIFAFTVTQGRPTSESLTCQIQENKREVDRLRMFRQLVEQGEGMKVAPMLTEFFRMLPVDVLDRKELQELQNIKSHEPTRAQYMTFITSSSDAFTLVKLELLQMMRKVGWVSPSEASSLSGQIVTRVLLKQKLNLDYLRAFLPAKEFAQVDWSQLIAAGSGDIRLFEVMNYFGAKDQVAVDYVVSTLQSSRDAEVVKAAANVALEMNRKLPLDRQLRKIGQELKRDSNSEVREAGEVLSTL